MTETDYYAIVLASALEELHAAISALVADTQPGVPVPRPRRFEIAPGVIWPKEDTPLSVIVTYDGRWSRWRRLEESGDRESVARQICQACKYQPRQILRALRRIQAATAWCYARAEGRRRAAQEILRQQRKAQEVLEAEAALVALKSA